MHLHHYSAAFALIGSCLTSVSPAMAQADQPTASAFEEILVTARKRTESIQDIPVAMLALSTQQIDRYDLTSLEKIAAFVPQFVIGRAYSGSGAELRIRGIGSSAWSIGVEQSVATVVDGVYYGQGRAINEGFFDLERVEVLKGPQALFFGKNATAGVVSLTTASPTEEFEAMARAGYEFESQKPMAEAFASGPLSDKLGIRIAVRGSEMFGGYFKNRATNATYTTIDSVTGATTQHLVTPVSEDMPEEREMLGRVTLQWKPSERLTATLKATGTYNRVNNSSWNYRTYACPTGFSATDPALACGSKFESYQYNIPADISATLPYGKEDGRLFNRYSSYGVTGAVDYELDNVTLTSINNYYHTNNVWAGPADYHTRTPFGIWGTEKSVWKSFSSEWRALTTYDGPVNMMAGFLYQKTKLNFDQFIVIPPSENTGTSLTNRYLGYSKDSETDGETLSGFGEVMWEIIPTVEITGGVRYTHETKDSYFVQPYVFPGLAAIYVPGVTIAADQTFNNWSPEATITWRPQDNLTFYTAFKTAYKSGGFSNSTILSASGVADDLTFGPEKVRGFEGGVKTTLLDNALRLNFAVYNYKYRDLQIEFFNSSTFVTSAINAGAMRAKGFEISADWISPDIDGLNLHGTLNYDRVRYVDFLAPCYTGQSIGEGCTIPSTVGIPFQNLSGVEPAGAPGWTASFGGGYETAITDSWIIAFAADAKYSDDYLTTPFGNPLARQKSYINLDASIRVRTADDKWELALSGKNLTNEFVVGGGFDSAFTGSGTGTANGVKGDQVGYVNLPRTVQLQLTWRY